MNNETISEMLGTEAWLIEEDHKDGIPRHLTQQQQEMMDAWYAGRIAYRDYLKEYQRQMRERDIP